MTNNRPAKLLRKKAVSYKILGPPSSPVIAIADYSTLQFCLSLVLLLAAGYLLAKTSYKETVAVRGLLEPISGMQEIVSPLAARVKRVHVRQGARIEQGDILATLSAGFHNAEGRSTLETSIRQLEIGRELLHQQLEIQHLSQQQSKQWSRLAAENIQSSKQSVEHEAELLATRTQLSERNLEALALLLQSGSGTAREYDVHYQAHLDLLAHRQALTQRVLQYEHQLNSLNNTQRLAELDSEQESLQIRKELQEVEQRITSLDNEGTFTVVAERSGIVAELGLAEGNSVRPNQPLFFIKPIASELQATLYVPSAVQARLAVGQPVLLRYDAFDYRLYGRYEATVASIGQARLDPRDSVLPILGINEPVFKVTAKLYESTVQGESDYVLHSGATLMADFVLSEMSLIHFIFKPILSLQGKVA